jgi:hypothetical protein
MTEGEWLACNTPHPMLEFLRGKVSERKLHLFAVACCRSIWNTFTEEESRNAVEVMERYVDGLTSEDEVTKARQQARTPESASDRSSAAAQFAARCATFLVTGTANYSARQCASAAARAYGIFSAGDNEQIWTIPDKAIAADDNERMRRHEQASLLRDLLGNPFVWPPSHRLS